MRQGRGRIGPLWTQARAAWGPHSARITFRWCHGTCKGGNHRNLQIFFQKMAKSWSSLHPRFPLSLTVLKSWWKPWWNLKFGQTWSKLSQARFSTFRFHKIVKSAKTWCKIVSHGFMESDSGRQFCVIKKGLKKGPKRIFEKVICLNSSKSRIF